MAKLVKRRLCAFGAAILLAATPGGRLLASQTLVNLSEALAARACVSNYTANVLPVTQVDSSEWDVVQGRVRDDLPANMPFQLVAGPDEADRLAAESAVTAVATSMPAHVRKFFADAKAMAPLTKWILYRAKPGVTNESQYLTACRSTSAWRATDFDLRAVSQISANMTSNNIPMLVSLSSLYEGYRQMPIKRAEPLVDYPDPRPELVYETPYGIFVVLRAPEQKRKFRFVATTWPFRNRHVSFTWVSRTGGVWIGPIQQQWDKLTPERGRAEIVLDWNNVRDNGRQDVFVFARYDDGPYGPPSVISFYAVPDEKRAYDRQGRIVRIAYGQAKKVIPALYQNKAWTDEYRYDAFDRCMGFRRIRAGMVQGELFSAVGEYVVESYPSDLPRVSRKVRYFTSPTDPMSLEYEVVGTEIRHKEGAFVTRSRGEFPAALRCRR